jgi:hypothetical protein
VALSHQPLPFSVISRTTAKLPRRPCAEHLCNASSTVTSTFAPAGFGVGGVESNTRAIAAAIATSAGRNSA